MQRHQRNIASAARAPVAWMVAVSAVALIACGEPEQEPGIRKVAEALDMLR